MGITFRKLHPYVGAEVSPIDLRAVHDGATLEQLRAGMDQYGVLVFRKQPFTDAEQLAFAQRFDGVLHAKPGAAAMGANRFNNDALADISNVDNNGKILPAEDRKRQYSLGNQLWHTDASFQNPAGRYSTLSARVIPPVNANTEFADMRQAYDELDEAMRQRIAALTVHHSIAYSRSLLGFEFSQGEQNILKGAIHPLVRVNPRTGRKAVYLASHAQRIMEMPVPEGRLLLYELTLRATQQHLIYSHQWRDGDFVIWDNLATMHRATIFDDAKYVRELRRVTTIDVPLGKAAAAA
ncbi:MAG: TauD/TfdA family dioxygenase [Betaproteobacteria bacterium]|nr:TauD/TfdA family dioxygenase [Betaproteobacteria bacterium]